MKRVIGLLIALFIVAFAATPAFAQGVRSGDHLCTGGSTVVGSDDTVDSVILFGCGARIENGARVRKDVVSFGGNVVIEQGVTVAGDVVVFGGNLSDAGEIQGDVTVFGGNITLDPTAVVAGNVTPMGGFLDRKEGAVVRGRTTRGNFPVPPVPPVPPSSSFPLTVGGGLFGGLVGAAFGMVRGLLAALAIAAIGALTVSFWPQQTKQVGDVARDAALPSLGVGCLTTIVAFALGLLLIITICGIPITLVIWLAFALASLVGWIAIGRLVGEKILEAAKARDTWNTPVIAVVVGILLLGLIGVAPFVGGLVAFVIATMGIGAVVLTRFGTRAYPQSLMPVPVAPVVVPAPPTPPVAVAPIVPPAPPTPPVPPSPPASDADPGI